MLDFPTWRDLAAAFVRCRAAAAGWSVRVARLAATGTMYVELVRPGSCATVRLANHRPSKVSSDERRSMLSIRQQACGRLSDLEGFLAGRITPTVAG